MSRTTNNYRNGFRNGFRKRLRYEVLEQKKLLAGDFASGIIAAVDAGCDQCEVQTAEISSLEIEEVDQALEEALGNNEAVTDPGLQPESAVDIAAQTEVLDSTQGENSTEPESLDPRTLDLSDSMDGYFGTISPDSPSETLNFTAAADGLANIVVASSFEGSDLELTATSSDGSQVEFEVIRNAPFDSISFEVNQGETYELTVSSTQSNSNGQFQLTVGFEEFVDQHADVAGSESTELTWADNQTQLTGKLEAPGDVDTFRSTSPASGEVTLELNELEEDKRLDLTVTVTDASGGLIAEGSTNEMLKISFDVTNSEEFFVAVSGGEGQKGDYQFTMSLTPTTSNTVAEDVAVGEDVIVVETPEVDMIADTEEDCDKGESVTDAVVDQVTDALEDELATAPLEEIEEAVDHAIDELEDLIDVEIDEVAEADEEAVVEEAVVGEVADEEVVVEVVDVVDELDGLTDVDSGSEPDVAVTDEVDDQVAVDSVTINVEAEETVSENDQPIVDPVDVAEPTEELTTELADNQPDVIIEEAQSTPVDEVVEVVVDVVTPVEEVATVDSEPDEVVGEVVADEAENCAVFVDNVAAVEQEEDREVVYTFGPDSVDLFFESLSQAHDEFHQEFHDGFAEWARDFWHGLQTS